MNKSQKILTLFVNIIFVGFGIYTNFAFNELIKLIDNKTNQDVNPLQLTNKQEETLGSNKIVIYIGYILIGIIIVFNLINLLKSFFKGH